MTDVNSLLIVDAFRAIQVKSSHKVAPLSTAKDFLGIHQWMRSGAVRRFNS